MQGWGTHLLPDFSTCSGMWTALEAALHINELERLAVLRAITFGPIVGEARPSG